MCPLDQNYGTVPVLRMIAALFSHCFGVTVVRAFIMIRLPARERLLIRQKLTGDDTTGQEANETGAGDGQNQPAYRKLFSIQFTVKTSCGKLVDFVSSAPVLFVLLSTV